MYSYRDNITGMEEAMNRKRAKYLRQERRKHLDNPIDLTGSSNSSNNNGFDNSVGEGEITVTHFNNDGSIRYVSRSSESATRNFRSQVTTESNKQKGIKSKLSMESDNTPIFTTVQEDRGNSVQVEDQYSKYDPEENADQFLINSGATIHHSEFTITDNSGNTRTFVRHNDERLYY